MVSAEIRSWCVWHSDVPMETGRDVRNMGLGAAGIAELRENPGGEGESSSPNSFSSRNKPFKSG